MTQQASDAVRINIGVPGRVLRGTVARGTTIGDALAKFGFDYAEQFGYELRAWSQGASRPLARQYSDTVETDMTIVALQPFLGHDPHRDLVEDVVTRILSKEGVKDIWIQTFEDRDGEERLRITLVLDDETAKRFNVQLRSELLMETRRRLQSVGEMHFPYFRFYTLAEIDASVAETLAAE